VTSARRRAVGLVLVGLVIAVACVFLGRWQWHRHVWRDAQIATVHRNYDATPVPVVDVLPTPDARLADDDQWRQVAVVGRYLADATVLLRNRPVDGAPAYHVLVPFELADDPAVARLAGTVLVVDRGWVPTGADASAAVDVPAPPAGEVTIVVRVRAAEGDSNRSAPPGSVQAIAPERVAAAGGIADRPRFAHAYGQLVSEDPAAATALGALTAPDLDPGSHLSYAFQWWAFAIGGLVGFAWLARREVVDERDLLEGGGSHAPWDDDPARPGPPTRPARPARPRRREGRAEAEEDALIAAQLPPGEPDS